MPVDRPRDVIADILYHRDRARAEARLAHAARCPVAARAHAELKRLHELRIAHDL